jgi:hypothetical protein
MATRLVAGQAAQVSSTAAARLRLADHVRACHSDGQVILLDLRRNRYLGVGGPQLGALADIIDGWPRMPARPGASTDAPIDASISASTNASINASINAPVDPAGIDALTRPLLARGLLTAPSAGPTQQRDGRTDVLDDALRPLDVEDAMDAVVIGPRRLCRILRSVAIAAMWLRLRSLHAIADGIAARRERLGPEHPTTLSRDMLRTSVAAYEKVRPLVFTARDRCLHDSLALVHFLAGEGVFARWVIGVQTRPFGAHAWVQTGATVVNDHPDRVRRFRPILVV